MKAAWNGKYENEENDLKNEIMKWRNEMKKEKQYENENQYMKMKKMNRRNEMKKIMKIWNENVNEIISQKRRKYGRRIICDLKGRKWNKWKRWYDEEENVDMK